MTGTTTADQTSMPGPDSVSEAREISTDPSGDDTSSIAGLWDASNGEPGVERYVKITDNGLFTDYDIRLDEGNCYVVTPMTLDLEQAAEGSTPAMSSIADGRSFSAEPADQSLRIIFLDDDSMEGDVVDDTPLTWSLVTNIVTNDLPVCEDES